MRWPPRIVILVVALAALVSWIAFDGKLRTDLDSAKAFTAPASQVAVGSGAVVSTAIRPEFPARPALRTIVADPFSPQSWFPLAKPGSPAAPPRALTPPPLPFRFVGRLYQDADVQIFLGRGDDVFPVKLGDTIDDEYRVESITESDIMLFYLPSGMRQTIELGPLLRGSEIATQTDAVQLAQAVSSASTVSGPAPVPPAKTVLMGNAAGPLSEKADQEKPISQPAQLRWDGPQSARAGTSFSVALRVTSGEQIRSAPMQLRFDPALLESVSVKPGKYFGSDAAGQFGYRINPDGSIYVGLSNKISAPASDAEILVLTFKPIRSGVAAEISVASLNLQGAAGRTIAYNSLTPFKTNITP